MAEVLAAADLGVLLGALRARGYRVVGPRVAAGVIQYAELDDAGDLPHGWTDEQAPGRYRLARRDDDAYFGYAVGPHSWKRELLPPRVRLWQASRDGLAVEEEETDYQPTAFVGVRPCELAAIAIQDRVFLDGRFADRDYAARRADVFLVAVECGSPSSLCFCSSLGTGPGATDGFDLALTELHAGEHRFLVRSGSSAGNAVLADLPTRPAARADLETAEQVVEAAARAQAGRFAAEDVHDLLLRNLESPHWDAVAERCLSCGNCTLVCPTCFCTHVEDTSSLDGETAARDRVWDTCFSLRYAEMHGGNTRPTTRARYRQWLTHKLATWEDQFGTSGCVGCGRCIAWCPAAIDIRAEVAAIRQEDAHAHA
ncbi:MAG: 4Fe-4S dicluster domain-containing protein [Actinobacteria bacterium]|nr:4Fe-4S dicluster domain-containing protein [Actinomycetota bacterium]